MTIWYLFETIFLAYLEEIIKVSIWLSIAYISIFIKYKDVQFNKNAYLRWLFFSSFIFWMIESMLFFYLMYNRIWLMFASEVLMIRLFTSNLIHLYTYHFTKYINWKYAILAWWFIHTIFNLFVNNWFILLLFSLTHIVYFLKIYTEKEQNNFTL